MTDQELEILLADRCKSLDLKKKAFDTLEKIFSDNVDNDEDFWGGFDKSEIKTIFDRFDYQIEKRHFGSIIRTRIGLYIEDERNVWLDNLKPIGYYELETDFNGEILDDYFVIEKEKYIDDIGIISHFQSMNKKLPMEYLRRNSIQYEFVAYISLIGTLFVSKEFDGVGIFIQRAHTYLDRTDNSHFDRDYLKASKQFLKMMRDYVLRNNLVTDGLKKELNENKNCS